MIYILLASIMNSLHMDIFFPLNIIIFSIGGNRGADESRQNQACSWEAQRSKGEKGKKHWRIGDTSEPKRQRHCELPLHGHRCKRRNVKMSYGAFFHLRRTIKYSQRSAGPHRFLWWYVDTCFGLVFLHAKLHIRFCTFMQIKLVAWQLHATTSS